MFLKNFGAVPWDLIVAIRQTIVAGTVPPIATGFVAAKEEKSSDYYKGNHYTHRDACNETRVTLARLGSATLHYRSERCSWCRRQIRWGLRGWGRGLKR